MPSGIFRRSKTGWGVGEPMRLAAAMICAAGLAAGGTIAGRITDSDSGAVGNAAVSAKDAASGRIYQTSSSANGTYTLSGLPAGTYDLTIPAIGFTYARFERKQIELQSSQDLKLDIQLRFGGNLGTPGDDPLTFSRRKPAPRGLASPKLPDGTPDLSGVWYAERDSAEPADPLPWARKIFDERRAAGGVGGPSDRCLPGDPLLTLPLYYKIVQSPKTIVMLWEGQPPGVRQIFLDQRDHSKALDPSWMGHSIARWEGDTLVVDTVGFNDKSWLGLYPHTEKLHVTERWRRPELARIEKESTVEDPETFSKPWKTRSVWDLDLEEEIHEYICNENETDLPHLIRSK